jgi:hypothetical protein
MLAQPMFRAKVRLASGTGRNYLALWTALRRRLDAAIHRAMGLRQWAPYITD